MGYLLFLGGHGSGDGHISTAVVGARLSLLL